MSCSLRVMILAKNDALRCPWLNDCGVSRAKVGGESDDYHQD